jgi:hypothetical protein
MNIALFSDMTPCSLVDLYQRFGETYAASICTERPGCSSPYNLATSESELLYHWRFTANQFVLETSLLRLTTTNFIFQLNTCGYSPYVISSLTTGWVCRLQLLLVLASAVILRSESRGIHDHILLPQIRNSPKLEDEVPVFISPRNRVARLYPQALSSLFIASYDSQVDGGGIRPCLYARYSILATFLHVLLLWHEDVSCSSETFVTIQQTTRRHTPDDSMLQEELCFYSYGNTVI